MNKRFLIISAWLGFLSVAFGAFAAHTLKEHLSPQSLNTFETAVRYQFYHVFALALTGILYRSSPHKALNWAGNMFIAGIIVFCGSLYLLSLLDNEHFKWIGAVTPIGGIFFLAGWVFLARGIQQSINT